MHILANPGGLRYKVGVCSCSLTGIAGSNPTGSMDICALNIVCCVCRASVIRQSLVRVSLCGVKCEDNYLIPSLNEAKLLSFVDLPQALLFYNN